MSDEIKVTTEEKEAKCFCQSKGFRKFLTIALGTFVGVYAALCLFTALHKPPMMAPAAPFGGGMRNGCPCHVMHHHHFNKTDRGVRGDFQAQPPRNGGQRAPFEAPRPEVNR